MSNRIDTQSPLPRRLNFARKKAGISQKTLGILAGIDEFTSSARVNQYEKGKHAPDFTMSTRMAKILKVPTSYLYEENDDVAMMLMQFYSLNESGKKVIMEKIDDLFKTTS